jgi:hypothetical protein
MGAGGGQPHAGQVSGGLAWLMYEVARYLRVLWECLW